MSIVAAQRIGAAFFLILYFVAQKSLGVRGDTPFIKRVFAGTIALSIELATVAWFGKWFG